MYPECEEVDSVSECLGKIAANNVDALVYAGLEAHIPGDNKLLKVNGVEPTPNNGRWGGYPLALFLYLNEGNGSRDLYEQGFLDWALGYYDWHEAQAFENMLMDHGFISCMDSSDPFYFPLGCYCP
ncbi:hypothetical protein WME98_33095 [Sorangium sp. So ce296]|uniref:hypothetical protein n=1 Tax=Sorangium sp. So ce296 TaxID=3133296 RepID=UPI003F5DA6F7